MNVTETTILTAPDGSASDKFGSVVSCWKEKWLVVGTGDSGVSSTTEGEAYVYTVSEKGGASLEAELEVGAACDSVAATESYVVVGSASFGSGGAAWVYSASGGWEKASATLVRGDSEEATRFGASVAASGDLVVVAATRDSEAATWAGAVFAFRTQDGGGTFEQTAKLVASDAAAYDAFGTGLAIDGNLVAVGGHLHDDPESAAGAVWIFETSDDGASFELGAKLSASDAQRGAWFGYALALDSNVLLIGAPRHDDLGALYVFTTFGREELAGSSFSETARLAAPGSAADRNLGYSAALGDSGRLALAGAPGHDAYKGRAYLFRANDSGDWSEWTRVADLAGSDLAVLDRLGQSVALTATWLYCGAPDADVFGRDVGGSVYAFQMPDGALVSETNATGEPTSTVEPTSSFSTPDGPESPTAPPAPSSPTSPTSSGGGGGGGSSSDSTAIIVAAAVGAVFALLVIGLLCWYRRRKRRPSPKPNPNVDFLPVPEMDGEAVTRRPKTKGRVPAMRTNGLALIKTLLTAGEELPGIGAVCTLTKALLQRCEDLEDKAADVAAAASRIVKTLEVLHLVCENCDKFEKNDAARAVVAGHVADLHGLLLEFQDAVATFGRKGWLRRQWLALAHGARLTRLDRDIVHCLDQLRFAYHLARDRRMAALLEAQRYDLEEAMRSRIERSVVDDSVPAETAAARLAGDAAETRKVAATGRVPEAEVALEIKEMLSDVQVNVSHLVDDVAVIKHHVATQMQRDHSARRKDEILAAHEVSVQDLEPTPFAVGGMAQVHRATLASVTVAVKIVNLSGVTAPKRAKLFAALKRELAIMVQLRSPLVVHVHGCVTTEARYFGLVMEYMPGGSLRAVLDDVEAVPDIERHSRPWARDIGRAMTFLYDHKTQHRDLKANNVLLTEALTAKVADFGLSRCEDLRTCATATHHGGHAGTTAFMSPELLGDDAPFTEKSDVYSYAVLLFEILTRATPFEGLGHGQIVSRVLCKRERPHHQSLTSAPPDLVQLMQCCWAHDPADRPTFAEVVARLAPPAGITIVPVDADGSTRPAPMQQPADESLVV